MTTTGYKCLQNVSQLTNITTRKGVGRMIELWSKLTKKLHISVQFDPQETLLG